jgi:hypothetical protein
MPTYSGDVTELGFAADTVVYEMVNATPSDTYDDGWKTRTILKAPATQEYATFEFVLKEDIAEGAYVFHAWGVNATPSLYQIRTNTTVGACITNMDGSKVTSLKAGTHYLLYVLCEQLSEVQVGLISGDNTVYFANVAFGNGAFPGTAPVTPDPEPDPGEPLPDGVEIGGLAVTEGMLQANMGMSVGTTFDGEVGAYKVYAEKQGKILFDTALVAQSTTFTFTVFIPENSAGTSSFEFALRVKDKDGKNPLEGSDGKYIYYTPSVLPRGEWKTFTVDISVIGNDCTEFSLMLAAGTTMWIRDISFA